MEARLGQRPDKNASDQTTVGRGISSGLYPLPRAGCSKRKATRAEVFRLARQAATRANQKPTPWVPVTESAGWSWFGLPPWKD